MKKLSPREIQVLNNLIKGYTNNDIARNLCISKDTVKMYLKQIYEKLGVNNRVGAAVKVISNRLFQDDNI